MHGLSGSVLETMRACALMHMVYGIDTMTFGALLLPVICVQTCMERNTSRLFVKPK